ncbi:hypothetical protein H6F77_20080 [Microcoleus sp. FACHB-831]|uniref:DUF5331 domain-containing protein n=1 Tax=Microcoleus sp. FACHB-831 TaxID=2692827 RepID=UPI0016829E56|nr:DUF5331 domain-containing protein [Microcoleus sp. FACHB-831]MBD1923351.1 hypothetical protein [Microcoleus sp. FACHB-831]
MNTEKLRQSLKAKWLAYYRENRHWLNRLQIWVTWKGQRRPNSSFILATLSMLDTQFNHLLPLIVDLNKDPDEIVASLGLNFDPDKELNALPEAIKDADKVKMLPPGVAKMIDSPSRTAAKVDESCEGVYKKHEICSHDGKLA